MMNGPTNILPGTYETSELDCRSLTSDSHQKKCITGDTITCIAQTE